VQKAKASGNSLDRAGYIKLEQPSEAVPVQRYASVAPDLYDAILNRCVESGKMCIRDMVAIDRSGGLGKPSAYNLASTPATPGGKPARTYVAAMCSINDPADAFASTASRPN